MDLISQGNREVVWLEIEDYPGQDGFLRDIARSLSPFPLIVQQRQPYAQVICFYEVQDGCVRTYSSRDCNPEPARELSDVSIATSESCIELEGLSGVAGRSAGGGHGSGLVEATTSPDTLVGSPSPNSVGGDGGNDWTGFAREEGTGAGGDLENGGQDSQWRTSGEGGSCESARGNGGSQDDLGLASSPQTEPAHLGSRTVHFAGKTHSVTARGAPSSANLLPASQHATIKGDIPFTANVTIKNLDGLMQTIQIVLGVEVTTEPMERRARTTVKIDKAGVELHYPSPRTIEPYFRPALITVRISPPPGAVDVVTVNPTPSQDMFLTNLTKGKSTSVGATFGAKPLGMSFNGQQSWTSARDYAPESIRLGREPLVAQDEYGRIWTFTVANWIPAMTIPTPISCELLYPLSQPLQSVATSMDVVFESNRFRHRFGYKHIIMSFLVSVKKAERARFLELTGPAREGSSLKREFQVPSLGAPSGMNLEAIAHSRDNSFATSYLYVRAADKKPTNLVPPIPRLVEIFAPSPAAGS